MSIFDIVYNAKLSNWKEINTVDKNTVRKLISKIDGNFVLVGGLAMMFYTETRNTEDVDFITNSDSALKLIPDAELDKDFGRGWFEDVQVDFLLTTNRLFNLVNQHYTKVQTVESYKIKVASAEGLLLLKCYALPALYQQGKFRRADLYESDIKGLLRVSKTDVDVLFNTLKPFMLAEHLQEIKNIVIELREKIKQGR